jgi:excisionase family DNA binding protein
MKRANSDRGAGRYLRLEEAAGYSNLSVTTLRRLDRAGRIRFLRPSPRRVLVDREALDAYLLGGSLGEVQSE